MSAPERSELSSAMLGLIAAVTELAASAIGPMPPAASRAGMRLMDPLNVGDSWRGPQPVRRAHDDLLLALLAGIDHVRNFAWTIRRSQGVSVSYATLARGASEAFGRANGILGCGTTEELMILLASLALQDIGFQVSLFPDSPLLRFDGEQLMPGAYRVAICAYLEGMSAKPLQKKLIGPPALASILLSEATQQSGEQIYSEMSAIAHGQGPGVNIFVKGSDFVPGTYFANRVELEMPRDLLLTYTYRLVSCTRVVFEKLVRDFRPNEVAVRKWGAANERMEQLCKSLAANSGSGAS